MTEFTNKSAIFASDNGYAGVSPAAAASETPAYPMYNHQ